MKISVCMPAAGNIERNIVRVEHAADVELNFPAAFNGDEAAAFIEQLRQDDQACRAGLIHHHSCSICGYLANNKVSSNYGEGKALRGKAETLPHINRVP